MTAGRIDVKHGWNLLGLQFLEVLDTVVKRNNLIVGTAGDECPGRFRLDLFENGILSDQLLRSIRAEHDFVFEIVHRRERIKKDLEIRPVLPGSELHSGLNGQIATRRTTHYAYPLRIAPPSPRYATA